MSHLPGTLKNLFPPGVIRDDDNQVCSLLTCLEQEFLVTESVLEQVVNGASDVQGGIFKDRWQKITDAKNPQTRLTSKGFSTTKWNLSNTKEHFESMGRGLKVVTGNNSIKIDGIKNMRLPLKCQDHIGNPLATFYRDESLIDSIERMRHAHIEMTYMETKNAQS